MIMADVTHIPAQNRESLPENGPAVTGSGARPRVWPAVFIVVAYWALVIFLATIADGVISATFMISAAACLLATLLFTLWWLFGSRVSWMERFAMLGLAIVSGMVAVIGALETLSGTGAVFFGLPLFMTAWTAWLVASKRLSVRTRRIGLAAAILLVWGFISVIRVDGVDGALMPDVYWRWTPTAEQLYVAARANTDDRKVAAAENATVEPLVLQSDDWPGFRGPNCLGEQ
jgi:hypothetical protein